MSKIPTFRLERIKFQSTKERKEFIEDMILVNVAIAVMYVATFENFSEGVKELHPNKDRKQVKKIKEVYDSLATQRDMILKRLTQKDLNALDAKFKGTSKDFVQSISMTDKDISLEYLAVGILRGLARDRRKTKLKDELKVFSNFRTHKSIIDLVSSAKGYKNELEPKLASDFVSRIKY